MAGPRGYCPEWSKSDIERQTSYNFTYPWNLENRINKQNRNKLIDTESILMVVRFGGNG